MTAEAWAFLRLDLTLRRPPALHLNQAALAPAIRLDCLAAMLCSQHGCLPCRPSSQNVPDARKDRTM